MSMTGTKEIVKFPEYFWK